MHFTQSTITTSIVAVATALALQAMPVDGQTHAGDVGMIVDESRIVTGFFDQSVFVEARVFGSEFGESGIFNFTDEPGFDAEDGTFPPQTLVGFNIISALGEWNGSDFDVSDETMTISFGSSQRETSSGFVEGFGLLTDAAGGWHRHLGFTLNDVSSGDSGIYLLELELWHASSSIGTSKPFFIVFDFNADPEAHDTAIAFVEQMLGGARAVLLDVSASFGTIRAGGVDELGESDDSTLDARSQFGFSAQEPNLLQLEIDADSTGHTPSSLDVSIESRLNNPGGTLTLSLRHWKSNTFESIGQFGIGQQDVVHTVAGIDSSRYVRALDARIDLRLKYTVIATFSASGFDAFLDEVRIDLNE